MGTLDFGFFFQQLVEGRSIDETRFYFADDEAAEEHYIGFLPKYAKPYWVGYCDIEDGTEFGTALELVNAPIFNHRTLKERWNEVQIVSIDGIPFSEWYDIYK